MKPSLHFTRTVQNIRITLSVLSQNWLASLANKTVFLSLSVSIGIIIWRWPTLPPEIPLWFSRPWGPDQLAAPAWLLLLPLSVLLIHILNISISMKLLAEHRIFSQILYTISLLSCVLMIFIIIKIIVLVT